MRWHVVLFTRDGEVHPVAAVDDLGLAWLILNWYDENRMIKGERIGIRDTLRCFWETSELIRNEKEV
jgi:hypothetical protein